MELSAMPYRKVHSKKEVRALYRSAFVQEERLPFFLLSVSSCLRGVGMECYFDADRLIGFTHRTRCGSLLFIMFFAVEQSVRGMGYGSAILSYLKEQERDATIVLNVEPVDVQAANYEERVRRMRFYEKNGFFDTGYEIDEVGGTFTVLSTDPHLDAAAYQRVFGHLSFGLWRPRIAPRQKGEA